MRGVLDLVPVKHERGARRAALASDAVMRWGCRCPCVGAHLATCFFFHDSRWHGLNSVQFTLNCTEYQAKPLKWPIRPEIFFKKKKKRTEKRRCEMHRLNLITNPEVCFSYTLSRISLHPNPNFSSLILHPSSLCALCGVRSCWGKYQIVWEKCVFPFSYSFGAQFHK